MKDQPPTVFLVAPISILPKFTISYNIDFSFNFWTSRSSDSSNLIKITVKADVKSVEGNTGKENMKKCKIQGKYAGTMEDIHRGTVFVRLSIRVNAIAHSCYDNRTVGKKDEVSFVMTHIDEERNVAVGLISRIIRQNL